MIPSHVLSHLCETVWTEPVVKSSPVHMQYLCMLHASFMFIQNGCLVRWLCRLYFFPNLLFSPTNSPQVPRLTLTHHLWLTNYKWLHNPYLSLPFIAHCPPIVFYCFSVFFRHYALRCLSTILHFLVIIVSLFSLVFVCQWELLVLVLELMYMLIRVGFQLKPYIHCIPSACTYAFQTGNLSKIGRVSLLQYLLLIPVWRFNQVWLMVNKGLEDKWNS